MPNTNTLELKLMVIMVREGYTLTTSLNDFQRHLKIKYNEDYTHDEIENALHTVEKIYDEAELDEERTIEFPEDFNY